MNKYFLSLFLFAAAVGHSQDVAFSPEASEEKPDSETVPGSGEVTGTDAAPLEIPAENPAPVSHSERTIHDPRHPDYSFDAISDSGPSLRERMESSIGFPLPDLTIGFRFLTVDLRDDRKGRPHENSFIGSIYKLEAEQQFFAFRPYLQFSYRFGPVIAGAGMGYDTMEVATMDQGDGDGDIDIENWNYYLVAAWPNATRFTPFGEIGIASYKNNFHPHSDWYENGKRNFDLDNSSSIYLAGGCDIAIHDRFSVNFYLRYTDIDIDGEYIFREDSRDPEPFTFTLENLAYGLGASYKF